MLFALKLYQPQPNSYFLVKLAKISELPYFRKILIFLLVQSVVTLLKMFFILTGVNLESQDMTYLILFD